ncbi:MAG: NAD(P)-dependent oxidoreductase, partial [Oscillospiraceae bacterium]|nr:NAD(P)-dependent oxidoreductase [Oscillospiraceae bacterium]
SGDSTTPYTECDIPTPCSVYGKTKLLGEEYVKTFCKRRFIIRTAWLYSHKGKNFVKTIARLATTNGEVKVVNDQVGSPTNVADLAHHIFKLIGTEEYGTYHGSGNGECSWYDFACKIVEYAGISAAVTPCTTAEFPTPTKRPAYSVLDNLMFRSTVGDEFRHWDEALKAFFLNKPT